MNLFQGVLFVYGFIFFILFWIMQYLNYDFILIVEIDTNLRSKLLMANTWTNLSFGIVIV